MCTWLCTHHLLVPVDGSLVISQHTSARVPTSSIYKQEQTQSQTHKENGPQAQSLREEWKLTPRSLIQKPVLSLTGQESTQHGSFDMSLLSNLGKVPGRWRLPEVSNPENQ